MNLSGIKLVVKSFNRYFYIYFNLLNMYKKCKVSIEYGHIIIDDKLKSKFSYVETGRHLGRGSGAQAQGGR